MHMRIKKIVCPLPLFKVVCIKKKKEKLDIGHECFFTCAWNGAISHSMRTKKVYWHLSLSIFPLLSKIFEKKEAVLEPLLKINGKVLQKFEE